MTPDEYWQAKQYEERNIRQARTRIYEAWSKARDCVMPASVRPAKAEDVIVGAVFWYPPDEYNSHTFWSVVSEPLYHNDDFKAYIGDDGARYGLAGAMVEPAQIDRAFVNRKRGGQHWADPDPQETR